jgi:hypothetical protein
MSSATLYDISIVLFTRACESLLHVLQKAKEHPDSAGFPEKRLYEDMRPLAFQVQIVSNTAKKTIARVSATEIPAALESWADDESTMDELIARTEKTLALLRSVDSAAFAGSSSNQKETVEFPIAPGMTAKATPKGYVMGFAIPNVMFHMTTAYAILRNQGVPLGKRDYLESFMSPEIIQA